MKITKEKIKKLNPCFGDSEWFLKNFEEDLLNLLLKTNNNRPERARWLFTSLMNKKQCVEIAIFSAKEVLFIFEKKEPGDKRPRKAIEITETWLKNPIPAYDPDPAYEGYADFAAYAAYAATLSVFYNAYANAAADNAAAAYANAAADNAAAAYTVVALAAVTTNNIIANSAAAIADAATINADDNPTVDSRAYIVRKKLQEKIIFEAIRILERDDNKQ